ncbi:nucleotidyl transferase AbiEii/AbiGii toxin family protein [Luteimonas qiangzhengi]|uniref:nucleotidyl transferase AbiEii/AbiGii toxin family protein n=1 Tax=Luteimonas sp. MJ146 TaxID=3129240 RepID=UPI0031BAC234
MSIWDRRYADRVQLLVDILPVLSQELCFALKGGTAINLFEHDLPRLSVDIDLTWLSVGTFAEDSVRIDAALERLAGLLRAGPLQLQVHASSGEGTQGVTRLIVSRGRARVQIETTPGMRGTVHPVQEMIVRPKVEEAFGFASAWVCDFADLYGGKMAAALSRQHPRDLFDVGLLLEDERADAKLWRTFLVYLTCSPKPAWELLVPRDPVDFEATFEAHFRGMTAEPTSAVRLLDNRAQLLARIAGWMDENSCAFLRSVEHERPDFSLIELPEAANLPVVRRKLQNLARRSVEKRRDDQRRLDIALNTRPVE